MSDDEELVEFFNDDEWQFLEGRCAVRDRIANKAEEENSEQEPLINLVIRGLVPSLNANSSLGPSKSDFQAKFAMDLGRLLPGYSTPSGALLDSLYAEALYGRRISAVWEGTIEHLESAEYTKTRNRLLKTLEWLQDTRERQKTLQPRESDAISDWLRIRYARFEGERSCFERELAGALAYLERLSSLRKAGRTKIESVILLLVNRELAALLKGTPFEDKLSYVRAAFCDASGLLREPPKGDTDFVALVSSRIDRARSSKQIVSILSIIVQAACV